MDHVGIDLGKKESQIAVISGAGELIEKRIRTERDRWNERIDGLDERLAALAARDKRVSRLLTMPQIGPVTALWFVATLDEVGRFRGAHQVEAYLGLVPPEWNSSELQRRGRITKAGNSRLRWLLVGAAWRVATHEKRPETLAVREWAERIARRHDPRGRAAGEGDRHRLRPDEGEDIGSALTRVLGKARWVARPYDALPVRSGRRRGVGAVRAPRVGYD